MILHRAWKLRGGKQASSTRLQEVQRLTPSQAADSKQPCFRCGKPGHSSDKCYYRTKKCPTCGKRGHIAKICQQGKPVKFGKPSKDQRRDMRRARSRPLIVMKPYLLSKHKIGLIVAWW